MTTIRYEGIVELQEKIESGRTSIDEIVDGEIKNIRDYNKKLNAFVTIFEPNSSPVTNQVRKLRGRTRKLSPLFGVPFTIKDNVFLAGYRTTAGSGAFQDFVPMVNADIVDLFLSLGSIPLGKTNLHELAMGATSSSSFFGPVHNPKDPSRIAGGSSGGSAVSVAMSKNPIISIGTDTGGSVRIPAALCGVCGFKPTIGTFSTSGVFPLSATLDHIGIFTKSMGDMQTAFRALTFSNSSQGVPGEKKNRKRKLGGRRSHPDEIKLGIPGDYYFVDAEKEVLKAFWRAIDQITGQDGFEVVKDIVIPSYSQVTRIRLSIQLKEAAWFYSDLIEKPELHSKVRPDVMSFFEAGSRKGMMEYMLSWQERISFMTEMSRVFRDVDFLVMPTCLTTAPKIEDVLGNEAGTIRRQLIRNTELFNLSGLPALTLPSNRLDSSALPGGIEIAGDALGDLAVLDLGERLWNLIQN